MLTNVAKVTTLEHNVAEVYLTILRNAKTETAEFRRASDILAMLLAVKATEDFPNDPCLVSTPLEPAHGFSFHVRPVLVPILRAGLSLVQPFLTLLPEAKVCHVGLERDHQTAVARTYYNKVNEISADDWVFLLDPMLASGGSAVQACEAIQKVGGRVRKLVCVVAAPEGIAAVRECDPIIEIVTPVTDRGLNDRKYILPGLGDYGDRYFGT